MIESSRLGSLAVNFLTSALFRLLGLQTEESRNTSNDICKLGKVQCSSVIDLKGE